MKKAFLFLAKGFEESEAIVPTDILRRGGVSVTLVSIMEKRKVIGAHEIAIKADVLFDECEFDHADMLILPGGMPGAQHLNEHDGLKCLISKVATGPTLLAAICAAPMVFGEMGLLKGKNATCYPGFENRLIDANYTANSVELDGNFITGKCPGAAYEFGFALLSALKGTAVAQEVRNGMFP